MKISIATIALCVVSFVILSIVYVAVFGRVDLAAIALLTAVIYVLYLFVGKKR